MDSWFWWKYDIISAMTSSFVRRFPVARDWNTQLASLDETPDPSLRRRFRCQQRRSHSVCMRSRCARHCCRALVSRAVTWCALASEPVMWRYACRSTMRDRFSHSIPAETVLFWPVKAVISMNGFILAETSRSTTDNVTVHHKDVYSSLVRGGKSPSSPLFFPISLSFSSSSPFLSLPLPFCYMCG